MRFPAPAALAAAGSRSPHGGLDERRRRRGRPAGCGRGERRRHGARGRARRAARRVLHRLRLRRPQGRAVRRVGQPEPAVGVRHDEAPRRGRGRRARLDRHGARGSSARPGTTSSARCSASEPSATRSPSSPTSAAARPTSATSRLRPASSSTPRSAVRHLASRGGRRLHLGRFRRGDLRGGRSRLPGEADHDGGVRRAGAPRPAVSILRSEKGAPELPHWRDGLAECLRQRIADRDGIPEDPTRALARADRHAEATDRARSSTRCRWPSRS